MLKIKKELGINEWLELIKEDKNLCGAYISISQYFYLIEKENQELKNQLNKYKNRYINRLNNQLAENVEPDFEDFYLAEIEEKANDYDKYKTQQKEYIKYLEDEIDKTRESIRDNKITNIMNILNYLIYKKNLYTKILQKYKEIIGVSDENKRN